MREIKFRAWDGKHKRFGYINVAPYGISYPDNLWMGFKSGERGVNMVDVDVVEQFTGLHDKNGKEIYEGDIVKWHLDSIDKYAIIESIPGGFKVQGIRNIPRFYTDILHFIPTEDQECCKYEVIGNIHENPELLK